jgi:hypothetical protein
MSKRLSIIILTGACLLLFSAFITDPFDSLLKKLADYVKLNPTEKIHLHLDKPYYSVGDDIWFKAYVVDNEGLPSIISKVIYVELINDKDSISKQIKLSLQSGIAYGDFKLPDSLAEGNYRIRAYTKWMRNAAPTFFFDKTIKIGNGWSNKVLVKASNVFSTENNVSHILSTIHLSTIEGIPYEKTAVTYEVSLEDKRIFNGRATTDEKGDFLIDIVNSKPESYKSGQIIAKVSLPNKITVVKTIPIKSTSNQVDVQFLPEGGNLIEGLPNKIAIKAVNATGIGENVNCTVTDNEGNEVAKFKTTHMGMGAFVLHPFAGRLYNATITFADGSSKPVNLPKVDKTGYAITVNNADAKNIGVKVMMSGDLLNKGDLKLIATQNGTLLFSAKVQGDKQLITTVPIAKAAFPSGIIQLTLFSPDNLPVCERIIFVNNPVDKIDLKLEGMKQDYEKREKVDLQFMATIDGKPVEGSYSIAVTNSKIVTPDLENESNIYTSLLLLGDLIGYVEKPSAYFLKNDAQNLANLDLLMLTQGWRKIEWKKITGDAPAAPVFKAEKGLTISGTLTKGGKPVANGKVSLLSTSYGLFLLDTLSDKNGRFNFDNLVFEDTTKFVVQARTDNDKKNIQIDLDGNPSLSVFKNPNSGDIEVNVNESIKSYLEQSNDYFDELVKKGMLKGTIMLKTVEIVKQKNPERHPNNLMLPSIVDYTYSDKDLKEAHSVSLALQGLLPGASARNRQLYVSGMLATIIIDGMTMDSDFAIDDISAADIETMQVFKIPPKSIKVAITLKQSKDREYNRYSPGVISYFGRGYYRVREFYSPQYDVKQDPQPDFRTTVYWNPQFISDSTGKAKVSYFNTDKAGQYRIVVEGIDNEGNLVHQTYAYHVK